MMSFPKCIANILAVAATVVVVFIGCKKNHSSSEPDEVFYVSTALKENFAFHSGSYWIYRDSLTGDLDSAFVADYTEFLEPLGCVYPSSKREYVHMAIQRRSMTDSSADEGNDRVWLLSLHDSTIRMTTHDDVDSVARQQYLTLTKYPFDTGLYWGRMGGCLIMGYVDSGYVSKVGSSLTIGGIVYGNVAASLHTNSTVRGLIEYNDIMYLSPKIGLVKVVISHPSQGIHHVWELQRYHIE